MAGSRALAAALVATLAAAGALAGEAELAGQARVLDGDTIDIGPVRVRVHGIDAPEFSQNCNARGGGEWPCGKQAAARLTELTRDARVLCDPRERDHYGRIVARCTANGVDLGGTLVAEGLAWAFLRYSDDYEAVEAHARAAGRGVWQAETMAAWDWRATSWRDAAGTAPAGDCPIKGNISRAGERIYHTPWSRDYEAVEANARAAGSGVWQAETMAAWDWRATAWRDAAGTAPAGDCPIKGNISRAGERIYHTPWSRDYAKVRIDEGMGERWFCDEAEAQAAGWRAPR